MDAALRLLKTCLEWKRDMSFNPCFDGCRPATYETKAVGFNYRESFNPCFDGCRPATLKTHIRFLMEC